MRRGEYDEGVIGFGKGIGRGAQAQDLDAPVLVFIRDMDMSAKDT